MTLYTQYNSLCNPVDLVQWKGFYMAFLLFKNCVIVQGVAQREKNGVAASAMAKKGTCTVYGLCTPHIVIFFFNDIDFFFPSPILLLYIDVFHFVPP